jgi:predicted AlkP superfamily phosphohydrolase/phosphomutase
VNVRGREASGVVAAQDYDRVCDQLTAEITALTDARSGKPIVHAVRRTRRTALDDSPKLPDADLIVLWNSQPTDTVESPTRGRIGPIPFYRAGSHTERGFAWISGPGIAGGTQLAAGRPTSVAPTVLALLGAEIPEYMKQPPLLTL